MIDYAFLALLFTIATSLAPESSGEVSFINLSHPDQALVWTRQPDGRWAMTMNGRDAGQYERRGDAVLRYAGEEAPERFELSELLQSGATRELAAARGQGAAPRGPRALPLGRRLRRGLMRLARGPDGFVLSDPSGDTLSTSLRLRVR